MREIKEKLKRTLPMRLIWRCIYPFESTCGRCGLPWSICNQPYFFIVSTDVDGFYMCRYCWEHSTWEQVRKASIKGYFKQLDSIQDIEERQEFEKERSLDDTVNIIKAEYDRTHFQN